MLNCLTLILICQLAGEALMRLAGAPVPGPVAGLLPLLVGLVIAGGPGGAVAAGPQAHLQASASGRQACWRPFCCRPRCSC